MLAVAQKLQFIQYKNRGNLTLLLTKDLLGSKIGGFQYICIAISRMRLGSHNVMIEHGRWQRHKVEYPERMCEECRVIEDEYHIIVECKRFHSFRKRLLPKFLIERPNMYKLITFINTTSGKNLKDFGLFCHKVLLHYNNNVL